MEDGTVNLGNNSHRFTEFKTAKKHRTKFNQAGASYALIKGIYIEITSWLVSAYDFYSRVVKDR